MKSVGREGRVQFESGFGEGVKSWVGVAGPRLASFPGPIFILKLAGTKNRARYRLARSWCACASHSPESGESCTVVIWFAPFRILLV